MKNSIQPRRAVMVAYLAPSLLIYILVFIVPVLMAVGLSFYKFSSIKSFRFLGVSNYIKLIGDPNVWLALKNNLFLIVVCMIGQIGIAFLLAGLLSSSKIRLSNLYRTVIYFPVTLSAIVIGYVWSMVFDYNYGILVKILALVGLPEYIKPWLGQEKTVMLCACIPLIWQYVGFHLVIILSAMTTIDKSVFEMAEIDGANGVQRAMHITLPLIKKTLAVCVFLCISANMKVFDHIVALTNGGPGYSSNVLALYAFNVSFSQVNMGYGSAISVFILVVTLLLFVISNGLLNMRSKKEAGDDGE